MIFCLKYGCLHGFLLYEGTYFTTFGLNFPELFDEYVLRRSPNLGILILGVLVCSLCMHITICMVRVVFGISGPCTRFYACLIFRLMVCINGVFEWMCES